MTGVYDWYSVPSGDLFFLVVGIDDTGVYESSWGVGVEERNGGAPSWQCGATNKDSTQSCP